LRKQSAVSRRRFFASAIGAAALGRIGSAASEGQASAAAPAARSAAALPALLGGKPIRRGPFPPWPVAGSREEDALAAVVQRGRWGRGEQVAAFESAYASLTGAKGCLATANGTSALITSLSALGIGAGDEVIVPPYTFVATVNAVMLLHALPVFVDTDVDTFQIDARKVEAAITPRTRALIPVHLGGSAADLDTILPVASRRGIPVIEDACQAHLAEWRGRKVGSYGSTGCFSFQASKNLNSGEGGAVITSDQALLETCYRFHNNSRPRGGNGTNFSYSRTGANLRLTEFQAALLLAQLTRLEAQAKTREQNAAYLTKRLAEIPGIAPARMYDGCTRNAWHLYMFRYDSSQFSGLARTLFLKALTAEGIPVSGGYSPLNTQPFLEETFATRGYKAIYPAEILRGWRDRNQCPQNDRLCTEAVWLTQTMLLGPRRDMDDIADAVLKVRAHAAQLTQT
jgi:dTDP-4-amino-4,6-dideoxygalactose transaminase